MTDKLYRISPGTGKQALQLGWTDCLGTVSDRYQKQQ
jgi:hypothetical protein